MPLYPGVHPPGAPLPKPHHSPTKVFNARLHAPIRAVMCDVRMVQKVQVHMQGRRMPPVMVFLRQELSAFRGQAAHVGECSAWQNTTTAAGPFST